MAMRRPFYKARKAPSRRVNRRKMARMPRPAAKTIAKIAKRVFNRNVETRYVSQYITGSNATDATPASIYGDVYPQGTPNGNVQLWTVLPDVSEGTAEFERIGVKISPTGLVADVDLTFNERNGLAGVISTLSWDVTVHVWWGYCRRFKNNVDVQANKVVIVNNMLEDGQGNSLRWLGGPLDHQLRENKEYIQLKHRAVRMFRPLGIQNTATNSGGVTTYFPQVIHKTMKCRFNPAKVLKYNEDQSTPENYAPFIIIGYQNNDGTQAANTYTTDPYTLATQVPALQAVVRSHLYYKDA